MFCDVYALVRYDDEGSEPIYVTSPAANVRCFIDNGTRRINSTTETLVLSDVQVLFDPDRDIKEDYLLKNGHLKNGLVLFTEVIVISPPTVNHNTRGVIAKEALCATH